MDFIIFIAAMAVLIYGADLIIRESERIAFHYNISEFVIGATLVALGTSLPEMAASMAASYQDKADIAVSNVIGSNIFNITLVLGTVFLVAKSIKPDRDLFAKDSAWAMFPMLIFLATLYDGEVSRFEGLMLAFIMVGYILFLAKNAKDFKNEELDEELKDAPFSWGRTLLFLIGGFIAVVGGAHFAVDSGSNIALSFGVSEWIVGLILISFGTSLPELVVSIVAAKKGKADMSIGNIIGSNMANISVVIGSASMINALNVDLKTGMFDIMIMAIATLMLVFITANKLYGKAAGIVLLVTLAIFLENTVKTL